MNNNENIKKIIIAIVIIAILIFGYILFNIFNNKNKEQDIYLKNYKINEYINTYISDEQMAKIYLNDYINIVNNDIEAAYNLLSDDYKEKKFSNINDFKKYMKKINYSEATLKKYYVTKNVNEIIFGVYDNNNNLFIFKTKGVMQYKVYLDDYTVEI